MISESDSAQARPAPAEQAVGVLVAVILLILAVWALWRLSGGVEFRAFQQQVGTGDTTTLSTSLLAQSFHSPDPNLDRIELQLVGAIPQNMPQSGRVRLLAGDGLQGQALYEAPLSAASVISDSGNSYLSISFPAQGDSQGKEYTVVLDTPGQPINSSMHTAYSPTDALSSGQMYTQSGPRSGDLAISAYYNYSFPMFLRGIWDAVTGNMLLIASCLLFLMLPGVALLLWLPNDLSGGQRALAAPCVTALAWPVVLLLAGLVGFTFSTGRMWVLLVLCALAVAARVIVVRLIRHQYSAFNIPRSTFPDDLLFWGLLLTVLLVTAATRLLSLQGMQAGVGMDAYHHTVISDLFVLYGQIPHTYEPYAPLQSFTYHFGFHGLVAALSWLSGLKSPTDIMALMPQVGQIAAGVLPIPALTLFGWKVLGNRWMGLVAGALVGLVSVLPAYYVEWSRFTEGQGLALLPVAWLFVLAVVDRPSSAEPVAERRRLGAGDWLRFVPLAVIGAAGLFLTHYRIAILYAGLVGLYLLWGFAQAAWQRNLPARLRVPLLQVGRTAVVAICSLVVLSPWLLNLEQNFVKNFIDTDVTGIDVYFATAERLSVNVLNHPSVPLLAALAAIGLAVAGWKETRHPRTGLVLGVAAGAIGMVCALYLFFDKSPAQMEKDLQFLMLGLSPVTWILLVEIALVAALLWLSTQRGAMLLLPVLAWLLFGLWSSPQLLPFRLPFVGYLDAVTLASGAWLPAALLGGYGLVSVASFALRFLHAERGALLKRKKARFASVAGAAVLLLTGLASSMALAPVHDRQPYITEPDVQALLWMRDNLPRNSYVLANSFSFPWSPNQVLGLDSGLWIPYLAGVRSSVQTIAAYNEQPEDPRYFDRVLALLPSGPLADDPAQWKALKAAGVTHIYIGTRAGSLGFSAQQLLLNKNVTLVYHKDAVWLFKIV